jgi:hypothetical protein
VEDDKRSGCSGSHKVDENVEKLCIRTIAVQLNLDKETVRKILSDNLGM